MKRTRKIVISQRVFTSKDLIRIADVLAKQELPKKELAMSSRKFEVAFADGTEVESESPEVFDDEWLTSSSRPVAVRMHYRDYKQERGISVSLHHGDWYHRNEVTVSGEAAEWVNANFQALKDILDKVQPQESWVLRHPTLLLNLLALSIGTLAVLIVGHLVGLVFRIVGYPPEPSSPWWTTLKPHFQALRPYLYLAGWIARWLAGFIWGAFAVRHWLLEMWPSIEFDFGLPRLQTEKIKRNRLRSVVAVVVLPTLVKLAYDLLHP